MAAIQKQDEEKRRVMAFVDASNIIYGCNRAGWKMDFEKLIRYLKTRFGCSRVLYYAGLDSGKRFTDLVSLRSIIEFLPK